MEYQSQKLCTTDRNLNGLNIVFVPNMLICESYGEKLHKESIFETVFFFNVLWEYWMLKEVNLLMRLVNQLRFIWQWNFERIDKINKE
ncbi:unnamed protein product [Paramecium sonneborni]|uniref:Uncharacterized protein n=1 Tax=Paramecium sonneborni TaxID=65129 RepID=A0A8S1RPN4_9CILI|nr:unnamed protein product [Paramecium sonneborni]